MDALRQWGFRDLRFPRPTIAAELNYDEAVAKGLLTRNMPNVSDGYAAYKAAGALDHCDLVREGARDGHPMFGIFEDDLIGTGSAAETKGLIHHSIQSLPPTADLLYLEFCGEQCSKLMYSSEHPGIARASKPTCAAAMIFTAQGAQKASQLCTPVSDALYIMYSDFVSQGHLEAYVATPPVLYQDQAWGGDSKRPGPAAPAVRREEKWAHRPWLMPCTEMTPWQNMLLLSHVAWVLPAAASPARSRDEVWGWLPLLFRYSQLDPSRLPPDVEVVCFAACTEQKSMFTVDIARWRSGDEWAELVVPVTSTCFAAASAVAQGRDHSAEANVFCEVDLVMEGPDGAELAIERRWFAFGLAPEGFVSPAGWQLALSAGLRQQGARRAAASDQVETRQDEITVDAQADVC